MHSFFLNKIFEQANSGVIIAIDKVNIIRYKISEKKQVINFFRNFFIH